MRGRHEAVRGPGCAPRRPGAAASAAAAHACAGRLRAFAASKPAGVDSIRRAPVQQPLACTCAQRHARRTLRRLTRHAWARRARRARSGQAGQVPGGARRRLRSRRARVCAACRSWARCGGSWRAQGRRPCGRRPRCAARSAPSRALNAARPLRPPWCRWVTTKRQPAASPAGSFAGLAARRAACAWRPVAHGFSCTRLVHACRRQAITAAAAREHCVERMLTRNKLCC